MITKLTTEKAIEIFQNNKWKFGLYMLVLDKTCVITGNQGDCNLEYCNQNNIPVYNLGYPGGTLVCFPDDIIYFEVTPKITDKGSINEKMGSVLMLTPLNGKRCIPYPGGSHNDFVYDGHKVLGFSGFPIDIGNIEGGHLSMHVDMDLLQNICLKPITKSPAGLLDLGVEKDDVMRLFGKVKDYEEPVIQNIIPDKFKLENFNAKFLKTLNNKKDEN